MKLSPFVIGVISAQSGDYDYTGDDDRHTGHYGGSTFGGSTWNYGSGGRSGTTATSVTCWESNNMGSHDTHHSHMNDQTDQYGWANTHYGHETSVGSVNSIGSSTFNSAGGAVDYHSALAFDHRLSGCIYEVVDWEFTSNTYNKVHYMTFGTAANGVGYDTTNGNIFPVWWHYFNAHVIAGGNTNIHGLVMANPTYEGLGYLNFIVTFLKGTQTADERLPSNDHNIDDDFHTDLYSNGDNFSLAIDTTSTCTYTDLGSNACYMSKYVRSSNAATDDWAFTRLAISSFPHNDLGKDFRFNVRMMHHLGEGDSEEFYDSYYFYRVNTISIQFPASVSCPYEMGHDGNVNMHKCMDSAGPSGHITHDGANNRVAIFTETLADNNSASNVFTHICTDTPTVHKHKCGDLYSVSGLMNTYDEYAQQEYGTLQEVWFQFYYKYQQTTNNIGGEVDDDDTGVYNYPNKLFNAFEVVSVTASCESSGSSNNLGPNVCNAGGLVARSEEFWHENIQSGR